jgi:hypothetical protein
MRALQWKSVFDRQTCQMMKNYFLPLLRSSSDDSEILSLDDDLDCVRLRELGTLRFLSRSLEREESELELETLDESESSLDDESESESEVESESESEPVELQESLCSENDMG